MQETTSQAIFIVSKWPGKTIVEQRKACAESLGYDEEKIRYWLKRDEIPQREWQHILDSAHRDRIRIRKADFVRHLNDPAKTTAATAAV